MFIGPTEAADIVAEEIKRTILERSDLRAKYKGECVIVTAVEPLCRSARKEMKCKLYELNFGEKSFVLNSKRSYLRHIPQVFSSVYICAKKSHLSGTMSSYDPDMPGDVNNKRGCLCFDIEYERGLFREKKKSWARYYVSVFMEGASDRLNESLAGCGARVLMEMASCRLYELPNEEIKEEASVAVGATTEVASEGYSYTIELVSKD